MEVFSKSDILKEFHARSSLIFPYSDLSAPRKQLHVREVNFRSEKIQAFSKKTLRISQTSLIEFVHGVSSELRIWNSFRRFLHKSYKGYCISLAGPFEKNKFLCTVTEHVCYKDFLSFTETTLLNNIIFNWAQAALVVSPSR